MREFRHLPGEQKHVVAWALIGLLSCLIVWACSKSPEEIKIGFVGTLTGAYSDVAIAARNGVILSVENFNQRGGVGGRPIRLIVHDDQLDPVKSGQAVEKLAKAGVAAIIGPTLSHTAAMAAEVATAKGTLLISPSVSTPMLSGRDDAFIRVFQSDDVNSRILSDYLVHRKGWRSTRIVFGSQNRAYTENAAMMFKKHFEKAGGHVEVAGVFEENADLAKFARLLTNNPKPSGIMAIASGVSTALLCQKIRQIDPDITFSTIIGDPDIIHYGGSSVEGLIAISSGGSFGDASETRELFNAEYRRRFGAAPQEFAYYGYDAAMVVLWAMMNSSSPSPLELKRTIIQKGEFRGTTGVLTINGFGDAREASTRVVMIRDGRFVDVD